MTNCKMSSNIFAHALLNVRVMRISSELDKWTKHLHQVSLQQLLSYKRRNDAKSDYIDGCIVIRQARQSFANNWQRRLTTIGMDAFHRGFVPILYKRQHTNNQYSYIYLQLVQHYKSAHLQHYKSVVTKCNRRKKFFKVVNNVVNCSQQFSEVARRSKSIDHYINHLCKVT